MNKNVGNILGKFFRRFLKHKLGEDYLIKRQSCHHIETSQLIYSANHLTGFYMRGTLVVKGLSKFDKLLIGNNVTATFSCLTHFIQLVSFYTPLENYKTICFLILPGSLEKHK